MRGKREETASASAAAGEEKIARRRSGMQKGKNKGNNVLIAARA